MTRIAVGVALAALAALASSARAGLMVDSSGGAFATLQQAVDAAPEGDTLLVQGGSTPDPGRRCCCAAW